MGYEQQELAFEPFEVAQARQIDPLDYDRCLVFFSAGKDSIACVLLLLELGVPRDRIELHHHLVDGREGSDLMDWPITDSYCKAFAAALGLEISFSWKQGGFEREMLRDRQPTAPTMIPVNGQMKAVGGEGPEGTRLKFPQVSASLATRWCSSYLKISAGAAYITHHPKFATGKTLVVTGERAEESSARAKYEQFEAHRTDNRTGPRAKRWVDQWRPVHQWTEQQVWQILEKWRLAVHPAYRLGWARASCFGCIFGGSNQWASVRAVDERRFIRIANYEQRFGVTIHRTRSVVEQADRGTPYKMDPRDVALAMSTDYTEPIFVEKWTLPAGAYGEGCGPS
jgi:3'-phosphoadenosine 5'-phosphosulfate sulfotransferase (PAPS reductase)/FAD synthetase